MLELPRDGFGGFTPGRLREGAGGTVQGASRTVQGAGGTVQDGALRNAGGRGRGGGGEVLPLHLAGVDLLQGEYRDGGGQGLVSGHVLCADAVV